MTVAEKGKQAVTVAVFGFLRRHMDARGLPYSLEREIPQEGCTPFELAQALSIPPEEIEAVFCNGRVINIYDTVHAGDRVAFFPPGTPGPYRVFLGMDRENRERSRREEGPGTDLNSQKGKRSKNV